MDYKTSYFHADDPILSELTSPSNVASIEYFLGFRVDMLSLHEAIVHAYDHVVAEDMVNNKRPSNVKARVFARVLAVLRKRNETGIAYAEAAMRNTNEMPQYTRHPLLTTAYQNKESIPTVFPRPANALSINTRHTIAPLSNRAMTPHQLRQMRGLATSALSSTIIDQKPFNQRHSPIN